MDLFILEARKEIDRKLGEARNVGKALVQKANALSGTVDILIGSTSLLTNVRVLGGAVPSVGAVAWWLKARDGEYVVIGTGSSRMAASGDVAGGDSYRLWIDTVDPHPWNDINSGVETGHWWYNTVDDGIFLCVNNTASNAEWVEIGGSAEYEVYSNTSSYDIGEGSLCYITGHNGSYYTVAKAQSGVTPVASVIATETIPVGGAGRGYWEYEFTSGDTSARTIGDEIYLSSTVAGSYNYSATTQQVGYVTNVHATQGRIRLSIKDYVIPTNNLPSASNPGEFLFSQDGATFVPTLPVVTTNGFVFTMEGHIVIL